jgi:hypothetical protein
MSKQSDLISVSQGAAGDPLFIDTANNRVGVGTSSPLTPLHVVGAIQSQRTGGVDQYARMVNSGGTATFISDNQASGTYTGFDFQGISTASATPVTYATITGAGNVGIGTSSPNARLHVAGGFQQITNGSSSMFMGDGVSLVTGSSAAASAVRFDGDALLFSYSATERMRIDSSGSLLVGTTSALTQASRFTLLGAALQAASNIQVGTNSYPAINFNNASGAQQGYIVVNAASVSYTSLSDYRLKENVVPLAGAADRLAQIPVHRFNFIADPDRTVDGFLAHEVQAFVPECVTGEKDQVETVDVKDEDGNVIGTEERPVYQGIDQSKLVPLLTAALQEALQKIDALETRISALETN